MDYISSNRLLSDWIRLKDTTKCMDLTDKSKPLMLPITEKSILGALVSRYSLVSVLNGKIRIFGGDDSRRASINSINKVINGRETAIPGLLIIADDICGGIFAINNGFVKNVKRGNVVFLPADSLVFEDLMMGYASFINWCMTLSNETWFGDGWKTSDMNMVNLREADEYILAKLAVVCDLREG